MTLNIIIGGSVGLLLFIIGIMLFAFKSATTLLSGYEPGKYDDEKLRKFIGWCLILLAVVQFGATGLMEVFPGYEIWIGLMFLLPAYVVILTIAIYRANKNYKLK